MSTQADTHVQYTAFGEILSGAGSSTAIIGYTGQIWDSHAGLYNYRNRWYNPKLGRFLSQDPMGFDAGDANLYRYVGNSPLSYTDPLGLEKSGTKTQSEIDPLVGAAVGVGAAAGLGAGVALSGAAASAALTVGVVGAAAAVGVGIYSLITGRSFGDIFGGLFGGKSKSGKPSGGSSGQTSGGSAAISTGTSEGSGSMGSAGRTLSLGTEGISAQLNLAIQGMELNGNSTRPLSTGGLRGYYDLDSGLLAASTLEPDPHRWRPYAGSEFMPSYPIGSTLYGSLEETDVYWNMDQRGRALQKSPTELARMRVNPDNSISMEGVIYVKEPGGFTWRATPHSAELILWNWSRTKDPKYLDDPSLKWAAQVGLIDNLIYGLNDPRGSVAQLSGMAAGHIANDPTLPQGQLPYVTPSPRVRVPTAQAIRPTSPKPAPSQVTPGQATPGQLRIENGKVEIGPTYQIQRSNTLANSPRLNVQSNTTRPTPIPGDAEFVGPVQRGWTLVPRGDGAHMVERVNVRGRTGLSAFDQPDTPRFYPAGTPENAGAAHVRLHQATKSAGIGLRQGSNSKLSDSELLQRYGQAYSDPRLRGILGDLRTPNGATVISENVTPAEAYDALLRWQSGR